MAEHRVVCTCQVPATNPPRHGHIVSVGTGPTADYYAKKWTVDEVWSAIDRGDRFYTIGKHSGKKAYVEKFTCCHRRTLRSEADAVADNNLDSLTNCV